MLKQKIVTSILIFLIISKVNLIFAKTMTCAIPSDVQNNETSDSHIKLVEPATIISFDSDQTVSKFNSPDCNKFDSISRWTNRFMIDCISNNADLINLKIHLFTLQFEKTYYKNKQKYRTLRGFCKISQT